MKKQYVVTSIVVCVIIIFAYLQYGREEKVVSSMANTSDSYYEQEFSIVANKLFIWDKEKYAKKLIEKAIENKYRNVRFSYDLMGYPNEINISVYCSVWEYRQGDRMLQVFARKKKGYSEKSGKNSTDIFKIQVRKSE